MFQLQRLRQAWDDLVPRRLVDAIAHCVLQQGEIATLQRLQQQRDSLQIEDNIGPRKTLGQHRARLTGCQ